MTTPPQRSLIGLLKQLGVAALYALLLYIGELFFDGDNIVGHFEPASGLALAALLLGGRQYAWSVLLGAFLINAISDNSLWEVAIVASGDTLQALCGAWLLTREGKFDLRLQSLSDYLRLILLGGCASIAIGALAVSTVLLVSGLLVPGNYFHSLLQWWMSDTLGVMLIAPLILVWWGTRNDWREAGKMIEVVLLLGLTILAGQVVFLGGWHDIIGQAAKGYWMFLIATWAAVRLGTRETVIVLVMTAIYALLGAIQGVGFFADDITQTHLVNYWFYMMILSVVGMALATHFTERKQLETLLRKHTDELVLHNRVLQQISLGAPLCEVLEELARQVEALHPGMLCSILLVAEDGEHLRHGAAPGLPDFYNQAINGLAIGDGMGACGTAAYRGERVIVVDVQQHAYWPGPYRDLAHQAGVQSCWSQPIKDSNGRVLGTFAIYHQKPARPSDTVIALIERYADLTAIVIERIHIQDDLRENEERFRQLAENIHEVFWMTDPAKDKMLYISPAYEPIWGRTLKSLYDSPQSWLEAIHGEDRQRVLQAALTKQAVGLYDEEYRIVRPNGEVRWIRDRAFPVRDSGGVVYRIVGVAEDITERKAAEEQIRNLAFYDALTQLPNRRLLNDRMGTAMAASKRSGHYGALMFLDLDNFKPLNDTHGHDMGDFLLVEAARRISSCVREVDTVARFGGDEFVVMLSELDADKAESTAQASIVAEKIRAILAEPYVLKLQQADNAETAIEHHCAASIGVVVFNSEASAEDILKWADMAMYQAKEGGRNLVRFFDSES